jgi:hypothetical protein
VRARTGVIALASPALGRAYDGLLRSAVEKGFLNP